MTWQNNLGDRFTSHAPERSTLMAALRKKIAEKKAAEEAAKAAAAAENPLPVAPPPPPPKPKPDGPIKSGFLAKDGALLYPDGSNEAAPSLLSLIHI